MKLSLKGIIIALSLLPATVVAEGKGKGNQDWAEKAALGYEAKAKAANESGKPKIAEIFTRMAQIKRDAGAAGRAGEKFSWDEYHQLNGKLNQIRQGQGDEKKHEHEKDGQDKKDHKKVDAGAGFLKAAEEYQRLANEAMKSGNEGNASIYTQLANIKKEAAAAAVNGKGYDWNRYFELQKRLKK